MSAEAEKDIITNLTEAVETLTRNNVSLMKQLRDAMKINPEMAKKLNLNAAQAQEPENKRLVEKERKNAAFERNLDIDGYLWTHKFRVTKRHSRQTLSSPLAGHQRTASQKISWETARQANNTRGWGWKPIKLVNILYSIIHPSTSRSNESAISDIGAPVHYLKADAPHALSMRTVAPIQVKQINIQILQSPKGCRLAS